MLKDTHTAYDLWTEFSQMKFSPAHCRQQTDDAESCVQTLGDLPLGLCYHGGDLRVTALSKDYLANSYFVDWNKVFMLIHIKKLQLNI